MNIFIIILAAIIGCVFGAWLFSERYTPDRDSIDRQRWRDSYDDEEDTA